MASLHYFAKGDLARSGEVAEEADDVGKRTGGQWGGLVAFFGLGAVKMERGDIEGAMTDVDRVGESAKDESFPPGAFLGVVVAWLRINAGDSDGAVDAGENARERSKELTPVGGPALMVLGKALAQRGDMDRADVVIAEAMEADASGHRDLSGGFEMARTIIGEFLAGRGRYKEALAYSEERLIALEEFQRRSFVSDFLRAKGLALAGLGRPEEAEEPLNRAVEVARDIGSVRSQWRALAAQAEVAAALGDRKTSTEARLRAMQIVDGIVEGIDDSERRAMFLSLPEVVKLRAG